MSSCYQMNKPELLAPAGSMESLFAAVNNGCDAVYLGGKNFNARIATTNFSDMEIIAAIDYCHARGVKVYITINTLYKNSELGELNNFCKKMLAGGADAFIVQDIGTAFYIRDFFPEIPIHASTQLTAKTCADAEFLIKNGFTRVIMARETSLEEIEKTIKAGIQTEVFVHGALCFSYSGQCLLSSMIGGRSGNRGKCAQPCRQNYELYADNKKVRDGYLLSPKDMMTLDILDEIVASGVSSLKIEGRMKSPEYVALAVKSYREQLDRIETGDTAIPTETIKDLTQVFNRGGSFNNGYFKTHSSPDMMSTKTPKSSGVLIGEVVNYIPSMKKCTISLTDTLIGGDGIEIWTQTEPHTGTNFNSKIPAEAGSMVVVTIEGNISKGDKVYKSFDKRLSDHLKRLALSTAKKLEISGSVTAKLGEPLKLVLSHGDLKKEYTGEDVQASQNQPLSEERLTQQLKKTGQTPFTIDFKEVIMDENIFVDMKVINELRRRATEDFETVLVRSFKRKVEDEELYLKRPKVVLNEKQITVLVSTKEQLIAAIKAKPYRVYFECKKEILDGVDVFLDLAKENEVQLFAALPNCEKEYDFFNKIKNVDGFLVRTLSQIELCQDREVVIDYTFNVTNELSRDYLSEYGNCITLSPELNVDELKSVASENCEILVYGNLPLMTTRQCPVGLYLAEKGSGQFCSMKNTTGTYHIKDKKDMEFPIIRDCESCTVQILNSKCLSMVNKFHELLPLSCTFLRLMFTRENAHEVLETINNYKLARTNKLMNVPEVNATYGHFFRGVE